MKQFKMNRTAIAATLVVFVLGGGSIAAAETAAGARAEKQCEGKQGASTPAEREQRQAERFQKADKNGDGFLTQDEIGDKRWEHMKVADANNDGKLSKAEIDQAHKDGKLGHHGSPRS